jgi:hypothetical protein
VPLTLAGNFWIELTDKLKRGKYQCKIVYQLKKDGLGYQKVVIDKDSKTG